MYVLVRLNDIFHIPKVQYHTELDKMSSKYQYNQSSDVVPFVNVVSDNSKRLFENMLQSLFRQYLGKDEGKKK